MVVSIIRKEYPLKVNQQDYLLNFLKLIFWQYRNIMKVLHFFKTYYPDSYGGVENLIFQLAQNSTKQGIQSEVLSLSQTGRARNVNFGNHLTHRSNLNFYLASTGFSYSAICDFKELTGNVDIVHYHFPWPFMDIVHYINRVNKPSIVTYHSDIVKQKYLYLLYRPLMYFFLNSVDRIVVTSKNYLNTSCVLKNIKKKLMLFLLALMIIRPLPVQIY